MSFEMLPQWKCETCGNPNRYNRKTCRCCLAAKPPHEVEKSAACAARKRRQYHAKRVLEQQNLLQCVMEGFEEYAAPVSWLDLSDASEDCDEDNTEDVPFPANDQDEAVIDEQRGLELLPSNLFQAEPEHVLPCVWCGKMQDPQILSFWCSKCLTATGTANCA